MECLGAVKMLDEVFSEERAKNLVLYENREGTNTKRVKSKIFRISF